MVIGHISGIVLATSIVLFPLHALAWDAKSSITGEIVEILWPLTPQEVATLGDHEVQFRFKGEHEVRLGEATGWLSKCYGRYCPEKETKNFELNTFSDKGLLYLFPMN